MVNSGSHVAVFALLIFVSLHAPSQLRAQSSDATTAIRPSALCWRGSPAARCVTYLVTEAGIRTAGDVSGTLTGGVMINTGAMRAWGATGGFAVGADDNVSTFALIRHRHWLDGRRAIDMAVGPVISRYHDGDDDSPGEWQSWEGVTGLVAYSYADLAAITLEFDTGNATPVMVGFRTGAYIGGAIVVLAVAGLSQW